MVTMLSVKISTKHQIAVPSEARKKLGLKAGDRLDVEIEGDVIHLRRHVLAGTRLLGIGAHIYDGTDAAERIRALRDEWEARQLEREAQVARDIAAAWAAARSRGPRRSRSCSMTVDELVARHRRIAIDANAFIYLFETPGLLAQATAAILNAAELGQVTVIVSTMVLAEIAVGPVAGGDETLVELYARFDQGSTRHPGCSPHTRDRRGCRDHPGPPSRSDPRRRPPCHRASRRGNGDGDE